MMESNAEMDRLIHFGKKGMKWGVRKSKSETGVSRLRGAVLDRNQRNTNMIQRMKSGKTTTSEKILSAPAKILLGKKYAARLDKSEIQYNAQRDRIESGKTHFGDKLETFVTISLGDLLVSRTAYTK